MEYELAKQLKDAGFLQDDVEWYWVEEMDGHIFTYHKNAHRDLEKSIAKPTLSELIEACMEHIPDKFLDIKSREYTSDQWVATSSMKITGGSTPEEAVARLWLELNKK